MSAYGLELISFIRQHGQGKERNAFLVQFPGVIGRGFAIDRAVLGFAVVHLACFLGKLLAHIVGIRRQMIAQLLELPAELVLLRRHHRDRAGVGHGDLRRHARGLVANRDRRALVPARQTRRHDRLLDPGRAAQRTRDQPPLGLLVVGGGVLEPAFETVAVVASECVVDHASPLTRCKCVGSASGSITSKRRPCCSEGTRERAADTSAGSMSANTTPGSVPPSAMTRPHGSTTSECPKVSRPCSCRPPCAAANTKEPFSIARARISTCQCASPVCLVKAEGIARKLAPASASAR